MTKWKEVTSFPEWKKEYYIGRSNEWDWFGTKRWWEYFVIIDGLNGSGGYWLRRFSRWNGSSQNHPSNGEVETLSYDKSKEIDELIRVNNPESMLAEREK